MPSVHASIAREEDTLGQAWAPYDLYPVTRLDDDRGHPPNPSSR